MKECNVVQASAEDVLESIDGSREPEGGWYSQSILKFELIPEYFRTKTQLELTCVGRSGSTFERRAYWPIKLPHSNQQQQQQQQQLQQLQPSEDSEYDRRIQPVVGSFPGFSNYSTWIQFQLFEIMIIMNLNISIDIADLIDDVQADGYTFASAAVEA